MSKIAHLNKKPRPRQRPGLKLTILKRPIPAAVVRRKCDGLITHKCKARHEGGLVTVAARATAVASAGRGAARLHLNRLASLALID